MSYLWPNQVYKNYVYNFKTKLSYVGQVKVIYD